jgi:TRAP-type C4-dicarboxylate transport system permease small subunit
MMHGIIDTYVNTQGLSGISMLLPFINVALIYVALLFLGSLLLKYLWNITMPRLFKLPEITYWEAFRLILIAWILLGRG